MMFKEQRYLILGMMITMYKRTNYSIMFVSCVERHLKDVSYVKRVNKTREAYDIQSVCLVNQVDPLVYQDM